MNWHCQAVSTPPPARRWWYVTSPTGERSRPYRTQAAARGQLKRYEPGSTIEEA
jgi:hypothetical protein